MGERGRKRGRGGDGGAAGVACGQTAHHKSPYPCPRPRSGPGRRRQGPGWLLGSSWRQREGQTGARKRRARPDLLKRGSNPVVQHQAGRLDAGNFHYPRRLLDHLGARLARRRLSPASAVGRTPRRASSPASAGGGGRGGRIVRVRRRPVASFSRDGRLAARWMAVAAPVVAAARRRRRRGRICSSQTWVFKANFSCHSDLRRHENRFLGRHDNLRRLQANAQPSYVDPRSECRLKLIFKNPPPRWVFKDYFRRHSDLCQRENWFLGLKSA